MTHQIESLIDVLDNHHGLRWQVYPPNDREQPCRFKTFVHFHFRAFLVSLRQAPDDDLGMAQVAWHLLDWNDLIIKHLQVGHRVQSTQHVQVPSSLLRALKLNDDLMPKDKKRRAIRDESSDSPKPKRGKEGALRSDPLPLRGQ